MPATHPPERPALASRRFPPTSLGVHEARAFAAEVVERPLADDLALVVSELASNAVRHAATPFEVTVRQMEDRVRVEVADRGASLPGDRRPGAVDAGPAGSTGRGLLIVDRLTDSWGVEPSPRGKVVWCELGAALERGS